MAGEARRELSPSVTFSPGSVAGDPTYELSDIQPGSSSSVATPKPTVDDGQDPLGRASAFISPQPGMSSRPLLLVRSSPALGTGKLRVIALNIPGLASCI